MTQQAIFNWLVAAFCDTTFLARHHVRNYQVDELRVKLTNLWFKPGFSSWITTYNRAGQGINYRRAFQVFGYVINHTYYLSALSKQDLAQHLCNHYPDIQKSFTRESLRSILGKSISDESVQKIICENM